MKDGAILKKDKRGVPIVATSPIRHTTTRSYISRKFSSTAMECDVSNNNNNNNNSMEDDDNPAHDTIQLCKVRSTDHSPEGSPQRSSRHLARIYRFSPQRLSLSPKILSDSWQDASTEPVMASEHQRSQRDDTATPEEGSPRAMDENAPNSIAEEPALDEQQQQQQQQQQQNLKYPTPQRTHVTRLYNALSQPTSSNSKVVSDFWQDASMESFATEARLNEDSFTSRMTTPKSTGKRRLDPEAYTPVKALRRSTSDIKYTSVLKKTDGDQFSNTAVENHQGPIVEIDGSPSNPNPATSTTAAVATNATPPAPNAIAVATAATSTTTDTSGQSTQTANKPAETAGDTKHPNTEEIKKEQDRINAAIEEEEARIAKEIDYLMKTVKCLPNYYKLVDKIGEGAFSTVYKALDIRRDLYRNDEWEPQLIQGEQSTFISPASTPTRDGTTSPPSSNKSLSEYVALKRVYHTSSPRRIANEINVLRKLRGSKCISPLITAFRQQDQVFVVMPYIPHDDFRRSFTEMNLTDIKYYMKSLLTALQQLQRYNILHRDVKPNNFLYNIKKRSGYLIDFGLAETEEDTKLMDERVQKQAKPTKFSVYTNTANAQAHNSRPSAIKGMASSSSVLAALSNKENRSSSASMVVTPSPEAIAAANINRSAKTKRPVGYIRNDTRHTIRANRAGTRGFRAPETLMRVTHQTCAIDVWSAGVILLCFFTGKYPFFLANEEADALVELGQVFGYQELKGCANKNNRLFSTNVRIPEKRIELGEICSKLNKRKVESFDQEEYKAGLQLLDRCLDLDHRTRITAEEALQHDFFKTL